MTQAPEKSHRMIPAAFFRWEPQTLPMPRIDPEFHRMSGLERGAETLRFQVVRLEFSLSPRGGLREWLKLNIRLFLFLAIPAVFLIPIATCIFAGIAEATVYLRIAAVNALFTLLAILAIAFILRTVGALSGKNRRK